ncbi:hypothetical protein MRX96_025519 [Rhipicephalus microplus]
MTVNFTLVVNNQLGEDPRVKVSMRRKDGSKIGCIRGHGREVQKEIKYVLQHLSSAIMIGPRHYYHSTYKLCKTAAGTDRNIKNFWNDQCPVPTTRIEKSMRTRLNVLIQLAIGLVQTTLTVELRVTNGGDTAGCQSF